MKHRGVVGGTPVSGPSLCNTCRNGQQIRGFAESAEKVFCQSINKQIAFPVASCSEYDDRRIPSKYDMEKIAWVLVTKKAGRDAGFVSAKEFRKLRQDDDVPSTPDPS